MLKAFLFCLVLGLTACTASKWDKWTSEQGLAALRSVNLEAENARPMAADDYGLAPMRAKEGQRFFLPSLCADCGGRVFSFTRQADLQAMKSFYEAQAKQSAAFFSWVFVKDNLLLQLNGELPKEKADAYNAALQTIR